jgi:hypothetical protein
VVASEQASMDACCCELDRIVSQEVGRFGCSGCVVGSVDRAVCGWGLRLGCEVGVFGVYGW